METRRNAIKLGLAAPLAATATVGHTAAGQLTANRPSGQDPVWPRGIEGQRKADLGDGRYLNPVLAGDYPDPSVLKDGDDYYMTHSSFDSAPGLLIWHSRDLGIGGLIDPGHVVGEDGHRYLFFNAGRAAAVLR